MANINSLWICQTWWHNRYKHTPFIIHMLDLGYTFTPIYIINMFHSSLMCFIMKKSWKNSRCIWQKLYTFNTPGTFNPLPSLINGALTICPNAPPALVSKHSIKSLENPWSLMNSSSEIWEILLCFLYLSLINQRKSSVDAGFDK